MATRTGAGQRPTRQRGDENNNVAWIVFAGLVILRSINALSIQTFFQPDEYFQALEPAWQVAFGGQSGAWITWEWREHLRSSLHPVVFAVVYRTAEEVSSLLRVTPSIRADIYLVAPKLVQAVFAALGDFFTWRLACKVYGGGHPASLAALALTVCSPWQWHCSVRTFSNSVETALTITALYFWPWTFFLHEEPDAQSTSKSSAPRSKASDDPTEFIEQFRNFLEHGDTNGDIRHANVQAPGNPNQQQRPSTTTALPSGLYLSLTLAALACVLRPTNLIIWITIGGCLLYRYGNLHKASVLAQSAMMCGLSTLVVSLAIDRQYYGEWTLPPLKFLYFNVVRSLSVFYGKNRHDYYITEGLPLLLTTALPFAIAGIWQALRPGSDRPSFKGYEERQTRFVLAVTVPTMVATMSLVAHKEVRFIHPLLPILHILAAKPLALFFNPFPIPQSKLRLGLLMLMLTVNVYIAAYMSFVHQRGVIDVMHYLRHEHEAKLSGSGLAAGSAVNTTVGFLMPCHSTPWRSHLIYPEIDAWALTCEPPLGLGMEERQSYLDEADVFYAHPAMWMRDNMKDRNTITKNIPADQAMREEDERRRDWPEYLVFFEHLEPVMDIILHGSGYRECWRGFNTHWHDDRRRQDDVLVVCTRPI